MEKKRVVEPFVSWTLQMYNLEKVHIECTFTPSAAQRVSCSAAGAWDLTRARNPGQQPGPAPFLLPLSSCPRLAPPPPTNPLQSDCPRLQRAHLPGPLCGLSVCKGEGPRCGARCPLPPASSVSSPGARVVRFSCGADSPAGGGLLSGRVRWPHVGACVRALIYFRKGLRSALPGTCWP